MTGPKTPSNRRDTGLDVALLMQLHERVTPVEIRLLEICWTRIDMDEALAAGQFMTHHVVWLLHNKLMLTRVNKQDCIWIESSALGRDLVRYWKAHCAKPKPSVVRRRRSACAVAGT